MSESLSVSAAKGAKWSIASAVISQVNKIAPLFLLSRILDKEDFGILAIATTLMSFLELFVFLGVGPAIVQKKSLSDKDVKTGFTTSIVMGLFIGLLVLIGSNWFADLFSNPDLIAVFRVLSLVLLINCLGIVNESLLMRSLSFKKLSVIQISSSFIANVVISTALAVMGFGYWSLVIALLLHSTIKTGWLFLETRGDLKLGWHWDSVKSLFSFGGGVTLYQIFSYLSLNGDNFLVGRLLGVNSLGLYSRAYNFMNLSSSIYNIVVETVLFPAMSKIQDNKSKLATSIVKIQFVVAIIGFTLSGFIFALAPELIQLVLGDNWDELIPIVKIMSFGVFFRIGQKSLDAAARAQAALKETILVKVLFACLIMASVYVGSHSGLKSVALWVTLSTVVHFFMVCYIGLRVTHISWRCFFNTHVTGILFATFSTCSLLIFADFFRSYSYHPMLIFSLACILQLILIVLLYHIDKKFSITRGELTWWAVLIKNAAGAK